jgi:hypothetical protein
MSHPPVGQVTAERFRSATMLRVIVGGLKGLDDAAIRELSIRHASDVVDDLVAGGGDPARAADLFVFLVRLSDAAMAEVAAARPGAVLGRGAGR